MPNKYNMRYELEFLITSYCQASCPTCLRTLLIKQDNFRPKHTSVEKIKKVIPYLDKDYIISLCGETGDPLMHPKIDEIIDLFLENDNWVQIHTNGGLRNIDFYKKYAKDRRVSISWGIDGMDAKTNSKYRVGVDFSKAWKFMNTWFELGGKGHWNFIIFEWNKHQYKDAFYYAKEHNIPIEIKINNRINPIETSGYVGHYEYKKIREQLNDLK